MLKFIFYGIWLIYFMNELHTLFNPKNQRNLTRDIFKQQREKRATMKWDDLNPEQKKALRSTIFITVPALILRCIGLFSYNWFIFLIWIIISFIATPFSKEINHRFHNNNSILTLYIMFFALINASFALFVILNSYHFHIDNMQLFNSLIAKIWH